MSALIRLANRLNESAFGLERLQRNDELIDVLIARLEKQLSEGSRTEIPGDLQTQALRCFWQDLQFTSLKEARLVSFGLCVPTHSSGSCIMDDRSRFRAVIDPNTGVDQWLNDARRYRRCYQGLVRSYFEYDAKSKSASKSGRENWGDLRDYLKDRARYTIHDSLNPDWVKTIHRNSQLFSTDPCTPYAEALLNRNTETVNQICEQLGIASASWFQRDLILAQIRQATLKSDYDFSELVPRLIQILSGNPVLRDAGLVLVLDRYARMAEPTLNQVLQNAAVSWWGNPWLPSNEMRWGGVKATTREMVADWLKKEFIEAFFTKLAEDGVGDRRRMNFWIRYSKLMSNVQVALGQNALLSRDKDFLALREKMKGLVTELSTSDGSNNAFVMTFGELVAVEFSGKGNALYGYSSSRKLPFDLSQPVVTTMNARNSLKQDKRILKMSHTDNVKGHDKWESYFEETFKHEFGLIPKSVDHKKALKKYQLTSEPQTAMRLNVNMDKVHIPATNVQTKVFSEPFSESLFNSFAELNHLQVEDLRPKNGNLWVYVIQHNTQVFQVLNNWGFMYKVGKGWWKQ